MPDKLLIKFSSFSEKSFGASLDELITNNAVIDLNS